MDKAPDPAAARRRRNVALGLALAALVVLFYAISLVRVGEWLDRRGVLPPAPPAGHEGAR